MNRFFTLSLVLFLTHGLGLAQQIPDLVAEQGSADRILINGKIVTMEDRSTVPDNPGNILCASAVNGKTALAMAARQQYKVEET